MTSDEPKPWWKVEDQGGFPPWLPKPYQGLRRPVGPPTPWPSEWRWRPHP
jgi:hypothetical protein